MKNVIEQIRKIKGVVTVDKAGENMAVVLFEGKKKELAVRCETEQQWKFAYSHINKSEVSTKFGSKCYDGSELYSTISLIEGDGIQSHQYFISEGFEVISFPSFIMVKSLESEWAAFNKPKSLTPEDLVDGRIYVMEAQRVHIFRFKADCKNDYVLYYSWICDNFHFNGSICVAASDRTCRPATPSEARSLIRAEIEHGYFHELKDAK